MSQGFGWLTRQRDQPEPRLERIATLWRMRGTSGRNIECAAFRTETGIELRVTAGPYTRHFGANPKILERTGAGARASTADLLITNQISLIPSETIRDESRRK